DRWFLNLDAKYILLNTDVTVDATSALGATVGADVDINPFIAGFGLGYKF
ncbi:MAG: OmpW family protein, partial [Flavobacteriaceae bacterium]|nr:OmpW family protein [Flavobacteriaceae bacterium]